MYIHVWVCRCDTCVCMYVSALHVSCICVYTCVSCISVCKYIFVWVWLCMFNVCMYFCAYMGLCMSYVSLCTLVCLLMCVNTLHISWVFVYAYDGVSYVSVFVPPCVLCVHKYQCVSRVFMCDCASLCLNVFECLMWMCACMSLCIHYCLMAIPVSIGISVYLYMHVYLCKSHVIVYVSIFFTGCMFLCVSMHAICICMSFHVPVHDTCVCMCASMYALHVSCVCMCISACACTHVCLMLLCIFHSLCHGAQVPLQVQLLPREQKQRL